MGRAVDHSFWLTPGNASEPGVWYAGTSPQGLFRSEDSGVNWAPHSCVIDEQNRIRPHIRFFVAGTQARDLGQALDPNDELLIVQALSGG